MAYTKINWENEPSVNTPLDEDNLNHMDQGIKDNDTAIQALKSNVETGSIKVGSNLTAAFQGNTALIGKYNDPDNAAILQIANGTADNDLKNLVTVRKSNSVLVECPTTISDDLAVTGDVTSGGEVTDGEGNVLSQKADTDLFLQTISGSIVSVNAYPSKAKDVRVTLEPIQSGSGDPSPTNVRAISGRSSVDVYRTGKNILDKSQTEIGTAWNGGSNSARARLIVPCRPNTTYTISRSSLSVDNMYVNDSASVPASSAGSDITSLSSKTFTTYDDAIYIIVSFSKTNISQSDIDAMNLQIEVGTTATDYAPYNGETKTISLGQTVYGGVLDVTSGELTITDAYIEYDGSEDENWILDTDRFTISGLTNPTITTSNTVNIAACNIYPNRSADNIYVNRNTANYMGVGARNYTIYVVDNTNFASKNVSDFKSALANNPLKVCYKLATPTTVSLTPTEIELLEGLNNVYADDGTISLTYLPETILPELPSTDGTYTLKCTIASGSVSFDWDDGNGNRSVRTVEDEPAEDPAEEEDMR